MKLYYKLIKESHGPSWPAQLRGDNQSRDSICAIDKATGELIRRRVWMQGGWRISQQPGELGELWLPAQQPINIKIKTGPFKKAELHAAVRDMNNDKAAGLDGNGIEVEKYIAGEQYIEMELAMYNDIL